MYKLLSVRPAYAYIWGAEATDRTFSGTWYNNWRDFRDRIDGQPFYMRRQ